MVRVNKSLLHKGCNSRHKRFASGVRQRAPQRSLLLTPHTHEVTATAPERAHITHYFRIAADQALTAPSTHLTHVGV